MDFNNSYGAYFLQGVQKIQVQNLSYFRMIYVSGLSSKRRWHGRWRNYKVTSPLLSFPSLEAQSWLSAKVWFGFHLSLSPSPTTLQGLSFLQLLAARRTQNATWDCLPMPAGRATACNHLRVFLGWQGLYTTAQSVIVTEISNHISA